jgi:diguanylate cyclase (GGDEF)-like protein
VVLMLVAGAAGGLWWMTRVNRRIREVAARDALTGLLNRRSVLAATAVGDARRRRDRALALVLIDVDHFKRVNDTHGHAAGDEVLRQVAARLRHGLRGDDLIARWGGEEFLLVLHGAGLDAAAALAERQRRLVAELPVVLPQTAAPLVVTVSAGVSVVADGERTLEAALERADRALYRAKAAGRNTVEVLAPGDGDTPPNGGATPSSDATSAISAPLNAAEPV